MTVCACDSSLLIVLTRSCRKEREKKWNLAKIKIKRSKEIYKDKE